MTHHTTENKDISWSKSEIVYTRLYLNKLESIMRTLSDALPTGHRAMANPTLQLHFGCERATPPISHSHNWPSGRMQNFLFKIGQKSYFLPIKTQKLILTLEWYYRSLYCRSNAMIFFKMANLKAISSSATLRCSPLSNLAKRCPIRHSPCHAVAWRQESNKPLLDTRNTWASEAKWHHRATMS